MGFLFSSPVQQYVAHKGPPDIVVMRLEEFTEADIIVNSTDKSLRLSSGGMISNTVLSIAGGEIQDEINKTYPNGIEPGDVAVSKGYKSPYKYVFHCSLQNVEGRVSHHEMREVIGKCLETAVNEITGKLNRKPTIAFPAIGTGCMDFPQRVIKCTYSTILEFIKNNPESLGCASILIYPYRRDLVDYIESINWNIERDRLLYEVEYPDSWPDSINLETIQISDSDPDYEFVRDKFLSTLSGIHIIKIERVVNKRVFVAYERYKHELQEDEHNEKYLWHGTKEDHVESIIRYGFDWRLTTRGRYGQGCYFALNSEYSDSPIFSVPNRLSEKFMFLVKVVAGTSCKGNGAYTEANIPKHIQSTVNDEKNPTIFVTYNDDQQYPAYLVVYKHV